MRHLGPQSSPPAWMDYRRQPQRLTPEIMDDPFRLRFYFARAIWPIRAERTPGGSTWNEVFRKAHGCVVEDYVIRARQEEHRERIRAYEHQTYGWSPLD